MENPDSNRRRVLSVKRKNPADKDSLITNKKIKKPPVSLAYTAEEIDEDKAKLATKKTVREKTEDSVSAVSWQELESIIRLGAEAKFGALARAETVAGVKCDCIIDLQNGSIILIEISRESSLEKLRTDLAKFNSLRPFYVSKNIFPRCFFICLNPTESMIETGKANYVDVQSVLQFLNYLYGTLKYSTIRKTKAFGSAVDIYSGEPDKTEYVKVSYFNERALLHNSSSESLSAYDLDRLRR